MSELLNQLASDPRLALVPVGALAVGVCGVIFSRRSSHTGRRLLELNLEQRDQKASNLRINYIAARCDVEKNYRCYTFDLVIRNASDTANSIGEAELWLDYSVDEEPLLLKVPATTGREDAIQRALHLPIDLDAHKTAVGSLVFAMSNDLVQARDVNRFRVVLFDAFERQYVVSATLVQEYMTKTDHEQ